MDALIIAGLSKSQGGQFSLKKNHLLTRDEMVMNYTNLRKIFGRPLPSHEFQDFSTPYLAGIYLYNYLTRRGIQCGLINFLDLEMDKFKKLLGENPKVIALSTTFLVNIKAVKNVTKLIRQYAPDIKIILGGPLVYSSYLLHQRKGSDYDTDACAEDYFFLSGEKYWHEDIDVFVVEEQGEKTLWHITNAIINRQDYLEIPNIAFYQDNRLIFTARENEGNDLSEDFINWEEIPGEYLFPVFPVRGSRGCPYKCKYCNFSLGRAFRLKSPDQITREIDAHMKTGRVRMIRFTDDNLFLKRDHLEECCRKIIDSGKEIKWTSFIRASSITEENIGLLKDSGCVMAQIGMESGDRNVLAEMNKKSTPEDYLRAIELLNSNGISTQLYFIVGFPGETQKSIENTIDMINKFYHHGPAINELMIFPFLFAPLSPLYDPDASKKYHLKGYMSNWAHDTMDSDQAKIYALEFLDRVENIYPHYGIEEFLMLSMAKLKKISVLRSKIHKAEKTQAPAELITRYWNELKQAVIDQ
ncbi:MAG: B12-binding domain-containing radical SAM protein [Candidatus Helarchaeota archaeon]|nr:B12-binding domain-containing radical SAM protein [Candidatus Helarchaeota archaeon]